MTRSKRDEAAIRSRLKRLKRLQGQIAGYKEAFRKADELVVELVGLGFSEEVIADDRFTLVDNYGESNVCWRAHAIRRHEIKIEPSTKRRKR